MCSARHWDMIVSIWVSIGAMGRTHVRFSPFGLKNQAAREAATMMMRPMMRLQLYAALISSNGGCSNGIQGHARGSDAEAPSLIPHATCFKLHFTYREEHTRLPFCLDVSFTGPLKSRSFPVVLLPEAVSQLDDPTG